MLPLAGMWAPLVFVPLQTFLFESLDFIADRFGVLRLRKEALIPASIGEGALSTGLGPLNDLNVETLVLRLEPMLGSKPMVSDVHFVLYSLFNTFHRVFGGTPLSPPQQSCNRFPYDFVSPIDACTWGHRRMLTPPPLTSKFVGMVGYAMLPFTTSSTMRSWKEVGASPPSTRTRM